MPACKSTLQWRSELRRKMAWEQEKRYSVTATPKYHFGVKITPLCSAPIAIRYSVTLALVKVPRRHLYRKRLLKAFLWNFENRDKLPFGIIVLCKIFCSWIRADVFFKEKMTGQLYCLQWFHAGRAEFFATIFLLHRPGHVLIGSASSLLGIKPSSTWMKKWSN